ncbi:MAG: phosphoglucosamine mutase [Candidatus Cloacimonetes bacterium]|nr:phosphoglucosamine mutase [Candidatus Cloacimonadota bacterium]
MSDPMISVSGIRGIFGDSINPQSSLHYAAQFGIFSGRGKIVVGRDSRTTGKAMFHAVTAGLIGVGCEVVDLGIVPTPTVLLAVRDSQAAGGISITASHNPPEWNALKFVGCNGMFLFPEVAEEFLASIKREIRWSDWRSIGSIKEDDSAITNHINRILSIPYLNLKQIRDKKFKVVIDSVNGAGGLISPLLLKELGCEVIEINSEPTGEFNHPAEPLNQNLTQLEQIVSENNADIGFAADPDVDRLAIVSNMGKCIGEELTVALAELFVLPKKLGNIVVNLSSSMISDYIAENHGVKAVRTKVGEINVSKKMLEIQSPIGGEGNGGVICPEVQYTRDALTGMALILGLLAERNASVCDIIDSLPKFYMHKDKIVTVSCKIDSIMENAIYVFDGLDIDASDGVKAKGENFWVHIRKSGTEPIIRIYVESDSPIKSKDICKKTMGKLTAII